MIEIRKLAKQVLEGYQITREEALSLFQGDLEELRNCAQEIRQHFCGNSFDFCTIISAKSGRCSEDCKYCAQSAHYKTDCTVYPLLSGDHIKEEAKKQWNAGVPRFSLVTSGRGITKEETDEICGIARDISGDIPIRLCGSFGLIKKEQYEQLFQAGIKRMHNNLESSPEYFPSMCSTHKIEDKIEAIQTARSCGMSICSGGIFGIGESMEDRVSLAFLLKELGIQSVPMNLLNPVEGTPYEGRSPLDLEEFTKIVAVYRFILPQAYIRLAGGRGLLSDKGRKCFLSGANAAITGDMLTTSGISVERDLKMVQELGFEVNCL